MAQYQASQLALRADQALRSPESTKNIPGTSREVAPSKDDDEAIAAVELGAEPGV